MGLDKLRPHEPPELEVLLQWAENKKSILEIGSRYGYVLADMARRAGASRVVSVDLPGVAPWGNADSEPILRENLQALHAEGIDTYLVIGDSKDPDLIARVQGLGPFDLIFIDGDHAYDGVKADWENYGPMGKQVVFHDISGDYGGCQVSRLWKELKDTLSAQMDEFIAPNSRAGIGRITQCLT